MPAHEKVSSQQFHMHMYHGTSSENAEKIKEEGLKPNMLGRVFLTHDRDIAVRWSGFSNINRAVVKVRVKPENLHVDWNSFEDPVFLNESRPHDSSVLRDDEDDWKNSLRQTGAATHWGHIPPENVLEIEHLRRPRRDDV